MAFELGFKTAGSFSRGGASSCIGGRRVCKVRENVRLLFCRAHYKDEIEIKVEKEKETFTSSSFFI